MYFSKFLSVLLTVSLLATALSGCSSADLQNSNSSLTAQADKIKYENEINVVLSDGEITADGQNVDQGSAVFVSNDVIYYEDKNFYESGNPYGEGTDADKHTAEEAAAVTVVNITEAGTYRLSGRLSNGQIRVDLGEDAAQDENAVVTLVLDGVDISCDVAPAVVFLNVYECDNDWNIETASKDVDISNAGANVIISDNSTNNIKGAYVAKIFKDKEGEKKLWKQDGAFYSYMSMNINGEAANNGVLNITADNEGLDSELHLTINGGNINIFAQNDGINTNEDGVSVTTINGGNVHIIAGLGAEGDGIDSNGWLVINGGNVIASANPAADAGLDSDMGSFVNGGTVVALGSTMDWAESDSNQVTMNLQFAEYKESDSAIIITKEDNSIVFAYDPSEDEVVGSNTRRFMGAVVSCPAFALEESYNVYIGGTISGDETAGIYDIATVTGFDEAIKQGYSSSDIKMHFGKINFDGQLSGMPDRPMPEGEIFPPSEVAEADNNDGRPQPFNSEKFNSDTATAPFEKGKMPPDANGQPPQIPDRGTPPWSENGENVADKKLLNPLFYMQDKVNNFSGVTDYSS